ncbi:LEAF RUST 10 DISEASE-RESISTANCEUS RECEPTOR-LIKE PROTEIN KINASE-like 2.4 isoform X3 [Miscanthus floridulus]|uniref:LEAF RUST 10 DISEASE-RESISTANCEUS RECEPTOR-LIKE PROTEIN KINASE-like 2.4 isoform X3 n=1 Tax=Miscanthus floridulus TaxID=154761 RepID=UPI00345980B2
MQTAVVVVLAALLLPLSALLRLGCLATATADADANRTTSGNDTSCAPATCGGLNITYPFSLAGVHPLECGYPAFGLTCDAAAGRAYLSRTFRVNLYRVLSISYDNRSMLVAVETAFSGDGACRIPDFNVSSGLGLFPVNTSATNWELTFVYNCKIPHNELLTGPCAKHPIGAYISKRPGDVENSRPQWVQANCSSASVPVRGFQDGMNLTRESVYDSLISDGFLLDWPTLGDCDACKRRAGLCRNSELSFQCVNSSTSSRVAFSSTASLILTSLVWIMYRQKRKEKHITSNQKYKSYESNIEEILKGYDSLVPKRYKYSEVKKITGSFKDKLGEGGYGTVFKGNFEDGRKVAVKLLKGSKGNGEEFVNEVVSIRRTSHVNIVNLLGFCLHGPKRALIYEYMANGSLEKYIQSEETKRAIGWEKLREIATGIARDLEYLHRGCNTRIIHFDIKPNNILLDEDFCPKIADFGLAKLCHLKDSALSMAEARGTIGFIAPEVFSRGYGLVSTKSDVYSYGMMLLEMVGGRKNLTEDTGNSSQQYFPNWVHDRLVKDLQSHEVTCKTEEIGKQMTLVGLWCIQTTPENRPSMSRVIEMLEKNVDELEMPPKPLLSCPSVPSHFSLHGLFCRDSGGTSLSTIFRNPTQKQII